MRHLSISLFIFFPLSFFLLGIQPVCGQISSRQQAQADSLVAIHTQEKGPGLEISVVKQGQLLYKNQDGYANLEHKIPITDSTVFLVGSISKQFTTFAILLLEKKGLLSLADDVKTYLPELGDLPYKISIRQLANHTSGFRNNDDLYRIKGKSDKDLIGQKEMLSLLFRQKSLNFKPGTRFQYCNAGYTLLAEIVSRVSGVPFAQYVQENIFDPLGMNRSLFLTDPETVIPNKADSYYKKEGQYYRILTNRTIQGSTGLYTTSGDLSVWSMNFDNPTVGNQEIFRKMLAMSQLNSGESIPYGLGLESKIYKGLEVVFHGGGDGGFRAYSVRVPAHQLSVLVTGNFESFNPLNIAYGMIDVFLSGHIKESKKKNLPAYSTQELKKFAGQYQIFPGLYIQIVAENDSLYFQSYGEEQKLHLPILGENEFLFPARPHSKFVFSQDALNWHFSDFAYPGKKVSLFPPSYEDLPIDDYLGSFYSEEIETSYTFSVEKGKIVATHPFNEKVILYPIAEDTFITPSAILGRVNFIRDEQGSIIGCNISSQSAYDIACKRASK